MNLLTDDKRCVELGGRQVEYGIRHSRQAKRLRIRVNPGGVEVVLPKGKDAQQADDFVVNNAAWVLDQIEYINRRGSILRPKPDSDLRTILFYGLETPVRVTEEESNRRFGIVQQVRKHIRVRVPNGGSIDPNRSLESWLRRQARADIKSSLLRHSKEMRVNYGKLLIMDQRTKWAGCSAKGNLSFNWRLVMAPPEVLDYIVVHELTHLIERDHSTRFWLIVGSRCPGYLKRKEWLRENEHRLRL